MGSDDFFKKKREEQTKRKQETREPKINSFLIVTEGKKTEPIYFNGIRDIILKKFGGRITVDSPTIMVDGQGKCTVSLVKETAKIVNRSHELYSQIWVVFDKDDFDDFDEAIALADKSGFKTAWSNQCFEYWIYLHFQYSDSALHRKDWINKLDELFKKRNISKEGYEKNLENLFLLVSEHGSIKNAVQNAEKINDIYQFACHPYEKNPCTTVHELLLQLKPFLDEVWNSDKN